MTFSDPVFDTQMVYLTNARKPVNNYANALKPFTKNVWFCIFGMLLSMVGILTMVTRIYNIIYEHCKTTYNRRYVYVLR